jgi:hypothetical protein
MNSPGLECHVYLNSIGRNNSLIAVKKLFMRSNLMLTFTLEDPYENVSYEFRSYESKRLLNKKKDFNPTQFF